MLVLHQTFVEAVTRVAAERAVSLPVATVLRQVAQLHGVVVLNECAADLLEGGYCNGEGGERGAAWAAGRVKGGQGRAATCCWCWWGT